jgi:DNA-binding CsgD family transcriptional regulator
MTHPNYLFEITRALVSIAAWWVLFYRLHQPPTKTRRIAQLAAFVVCYTGWILIPLSDTGNVILWAAMIFLFALIAGDWHNSIFTALYYIGMEAAIDTVRYFFIMYIFGERIAPYTPAYYAQFNLQYLVVLGWTVFYYWIMKGRSDRLPLRFWIITVSPPFVTTLLLTRYADTTRIALAGGISVHLDGILFGLFLIGLDLAMFYLYLKLSIDYDKRGAVIADAETVPLYTPAEGVSGAFVEKYGISVMEKKVIDTMLLGKTNKEIAAILFIESRTVEYHLQNVYRKTGASNRFALYALIRS